MNWLIFAFFRVIRCTLGIFRFRFSKRKKKKYTSQNIQLHRIVGSSCLCLIAEWLSLQDIQRLLQVNQEMYDVWIDAHHLKSKLLFRDLFQSLKKISDFIFQETVTHSSLTTSWNDRIEFIKTYICWLIVAQVRRWDFQEIELQIFFQDWNSVLKNVLQKSKHLYAYFPKKLNDPHNWSRWLVDKSQKKYLLQVTRTLRQFHRQYGKDFETWPWDGQ